jgi:sulfate transport system ATP-binding protein
MTDAIIVQGANKHYGDFAALDNVDFVVPEGSLTALLGPSGSGKSTLLRAIAGLDQPDTGTITIKGQDVTNVPPQRRGIGFVFQHYAAFKHLSVRDNVAFGLKIRKRPKAEVKEKVDNLLEVVGLSGFQSRYPNQLSGGQRQRMATTCVRGCGACTTRCMSRQCSSPTTKRRRSTSLTASRC